MAAFRSRECLAQFTLAWLIQGFIPLPREDFVLVDAKFGEFGSVIGVDADFRVLA